MPPLNLTEAGGRNDWLPRLTPHASVTAIAAKGACALRPDEENAKYDHAGEEEGVRAAGACPCQGRQSNRTGSYESRAD